MVDGSREIPNELKAKRSLPGLGPEYVFSPKLRTEIEEMTKKRDREYVELLQQDLVKNVLPIGLKDMEDVLELCRKSLLRKLGETDYKQAVKAFDEEATDLLENGVELLAAKRKKRPNYRKENPKQRGQDQRNGPKKRKFDGKENRHHKKFKRN